MNCPTRDPEPKGKVGHNQNPSSFDNDSTTNQSFNKDQQRNRSSNGKNKSEDDSLGIGEGGGGGGGGGKTDSITNNDENLIWGNSNEVKFVSNSNMESQIDFENNSNNSNSPINSNTITPIDSSTFNSDNNNNNVPHSQPLNSRPTNSEFNPLNKELDPNPSSPSNKVPPFEISSKDLNRQLKNLQKPSSLLNSSSSDIIKKVRFDTTTEEFSHSLSFSSDEDLDETNQYTTNIPLLKQIDILKGIRNNSKLRSDKTTSIDSTINSTIDLDPTSNMPPTTQAETTSSPGRRRRSTVLNPLHANNYGTSNPFSSDDDDDEDEDDINNDYYNYTHNQTPNQHYHPSNPFTSSPPSSLLNSSSMSFKEKIDYLINHSRKVAYKYVRFIGPGIMVSVAYLDPGNYSTAVSAGAMYQYKHLFVILLSNIFAVFLQVLCVKLGSVTGQDLAQNCREHLPRWLCIVIYILAEIAIIATDLAEVVGTAIALNILVGIPLPLGVILTVADVLLVLLAYRPNGPVKFIRYFEYMVSALVFVVVICFAVELMSIGPIGFGTVMRGFLPSYELIESQGLYMSCGILGATVMPHSLYLGSGLVQPRLREFDTKHGYFVEENENDLNENDINDSDDYSPSINYENKYRPSVHAIKYAMNFSIAELVMSLFTVAIFVNSAILIVAAATLSHSPEARDADLFSIYDMLWKYLGHLAAIVFALALLFSGQSAGIVCTLAGQMVSEGFLHWSFQPWIRRLITRAIAIAPCLFVAVFVGRKGLADVLNASQVVLSLLLPFVSAPLLFFTRSKNIMKVKVTDRTTTTTTTTTTNETYSRIENEESTLDHTNTSPPVAYIDMSNSKLTNIIAIFIFAFVSSLNIFLIISMAIGADVNL